MKQPIDYRRFQIMYATKENAEVVAAIAERLDEPVPTGEGFKELYLKDTKAIKICGSKDVIDLLDKFLIKCGIIAEKNLYYLRIK